MIGVTYIVKWDNGVLKHCYSFGTYVEVQEHIKKFAGYGGTITVYAKHGDQETKIL